MLQLHHLFAFITTAPYECRFYKILKGGDRSVDYKFYKMICDDVLDFSSWYRFAGAAGTQLSTSCVPMHRCGTEFPLWMDGEYPTEEEGRVRRRVCQSFSTGSTGSYDCCHLKTAITVRKCSGFYVHKFSPPPWCSARYCGCSPKGKPQNSLGVIIN